MTAMGMRASGTAMRAQRPDRLVGWRAVAVWLAVAVPIGACVASVPVNPDTEPMPTFALVMFVTIAASLGIVGALVGTRQPRNAVGWILWASSIAIAVSLVAEVAFSLLAPAAGAVTTGLAVVAWLSGIGLQPAIVGIVVFVPLLFPNGRVLGPRWRWVVASALVIVVSITLGAAFRPGPLDDYPDVQNPFGVPALDAISSWLDIAKGPGIMLAAILAITSSILRFRRAGTVERTQLRWFGAATGLTISLFTLSIAGSAPGVELQALADLGWIGGLASLSLIPIAIGVAILRYRLYDIDRIISRTIGWALVTGILVVTFAVVVVGLQAALAPVTESNTLAVAASTLVVFALFQPLRRRVQRAVDRRFDRARYDGQHMAEAFAERLRSEIELGAIRTSLAETAGEAVRPATTGIWLRAGAARR